MLLANRVALRYDIRMINSFKHSGVEAFFNSGTKAGIQPHHAPRLARQLNQLNRAKAPSDMNVPGWRLHQLTTGEWSVWVNGNWRLTFAMEGEDAVLINYLDYH